MSSIKKFIKKHDRFHIALKLYVKLFSIVYNKKYRTDTEKHNPSGKKEFERTPYIIRRIAHNVGLFSYFNTILGGIAFADENGYIPVVDMKNYRNLYIYDGEKGRVNSWEYYFTQPAGLSLEDVLSSKKYILGRDTALHKYPGIKTMLNKDGELERWRNLCKKYIHFQPEVLKRLEAMQEKYKDKKILGVLVRGTDYIAKKPKGHPIPPTAEQAIMKAKEIMQAKNYDVIYLATEDKNILAKFQQEFGEKLLLPEARYIDYNYDTKEYLAEYINNDKYLRGLEYCVSMLFLSKCKGFVAAMANGSVSAILLSEGFEDLYVFDLGVYP